MTHFLKDILRQPEELRRTIEHLAGPDGAGRGALGAATAAVRGVRHVYLTGIGSSWHAALNVGAIFHQHAHPVYVLDADELLRFAAFPKDSAMIVISRSGKSTEIVQLAAKARKAGVTVIGITNAPEGTLAKEAHIAIVVPIQFDHAISVNTYTTLALAAGMLADTAVAEKEKADSSASGCGGPQPEGRNDKSGVLQRGARAPLNVRVSMSELKLRPPDDPDTASLQGLKPHESETGTAELNLRAPGFVLRDSASETAQARVPVLPEPFGSELAASLSRAIAEAGRAIPRWQEQIAASAWLKPHSTTYFLARGSSLGSAYEARLMWEEGVKSPATAMGTGSFRHGPQEIVAPRAGARPTESADKAMRFGMWIDGARMREQNLAVARDLQKLGARVMLIGQKLPKDAGDLVFQLPEIQPDWQFLIDIIPAQLVAERLSRLSGVDCDTFRLSSYIVEDEGGLLPREKGKETQGAIKARNSKREIRNSRRKKRTR